MCTVTPLSFAPEAITASIREQGRVDIDDSTGVFLDHTGRDTLQISRQHDQIDAEFAEELEQLRSVVGRVKRRDIDRRGRTPYERWRVRAIRCDEHDPRYPLARETLEMLYDCLKI